MPPLAGPGSRTRSFLRPSPGYKAHGHRLPTATVRLGDSRIEETSRESETIEFYVCSFYVCSSTHPLNRIDLGLTPETHSLTPKNRHHFTRNLFSDPRATCGLYTHFFWSHSVKRFSSKVHEFVPQSAA